MSPLTDHTGKPSNIRYTSLISMLTASTLALAPLWNGPEISFEVIAIFAIGGPGMKVIQAVRERK